MKVTHNLTERISKQSDDPHLSFFLMSRSGTYLSLPCDTSKDITNHSGYIFHVPGEGNEQMYKSIESIYLTSANGSRKIPFEIINNFNSVERAYDGCIEKFTLVRNGIIYELRTDETVYINVEVDFRHIYEYDDRGREYDIHKVEDNLLITYNKYIDAKSKQYSSYLIIGGIHEAYELPGNWIRKEYSYDASRGARSEFYVYNALRVACKSDTTLTFAFGLHKEEAMSRLLDIGRNIDTIRKIHYAYETNHLGTKFELSKISGRNIAFGYINSLHALDGMMVVTDHIKGLWAGLPWFFQYWSRDELVSLKALVIEGKSEYAKDVIMRHINSIQMNGRLPNIYTPQGTRGLGSADSIGWLFRRVKDIMMLYEKEDTENYFTLYELKYIRERLAFSIKQLSINHLENGLIRNEALETWMDTGCGDDTRSGFRIEIQCAYLCMLSLMNMLEHLLSNKLVKKNDKLVSVSLPSNNLRTLERETAQLVRERFFKEGYLNDGYGCANSDVTRPNIFLAYYLYPELFSRDEWMTIFDNAIRRIWCEWHDGEMGGLATIDKENPLFQAHYTGQDNRSYHRGDSWFYINNIAAICLYDLDKDRYFSYVKKILNASTEDILYRGFIGFSSELSSARELTSSGCICQTWSIATYIELIHEVFMD